MNTNNELIEICEKAVLDFNCLVFKNEFKQTVDYLTLCSNLLQEELEEYSEALLTGNKKQILKELADVFVVKTQLKYAVLSFEKLNPDLASSIDILLTLANIDLETGIKTYGHKTVVSAIMAVNKSNMTKIPYLFQVREYYGPNWAETACEWIEENNKGRYQNVKASLVDYMGDYRVVFRDCDGEGKVLKWYGYQEPVLDGV